MRTLPGRLRHDRRGSTAVEFAVVSVMMATCFFAIVNGGLFLWAKGTLQSVASQAARCGAIGGSPCSAGVPAYAVSLATSWFSASLIGTSNVTASSGQTKCPPSGSTYITGNFYYVSITSTYMSNLNMPLIFSNYPITAQACYPQ